MLLGIRFVGCQLQVNWVVRIVTYECTAWKYTINVAKDVFLQMGHIDVHSDSKASTLRPGLALGEYDKRYVILFIELYK